MRVTFPRTSHVVNGPLTGGGVSRDDLVISNEEALLFLEPVAAALAAPPAAAALPTTWLVVEEKTDGANLGISLSVDGALQCQNRSHFVNSKTHSQFATLDRFLELHRAGFCDLFHTLAAERGGAPSDYVVFGEWCVCTHSVFYDSLPQPLVVFDLCKIVATSAPPVVVVPGACESKPRARTPPPVVSHCSPPAEAPVFFSIDVRDYYVHRFCPSLPVAPRLLQQQLPADGGSAAVSWDAVHALWQQQPSAFSSGECMEGIVVRQELRWAGATTTDGQLLRRCKAVRDDFLAGMVNGHWTKQPLRKNIVLHQAPRLQDS